MKEIMLKRIPLAILLVLQALGSGAVSLAHARDGVVPPPGIEASHTARCAILHDELRCALCQYASARVVTQQTFTLPAPTAAVRTVFSEPVEWVAAVVQSTAPARAPPPSLS